jgi:hypothetical protein
VSAARSSLARLRGLLAGAVLATFALGGVACDLQPQGKVAQGQLYLSGEARYDAYFRDVHAIQVWAAQWPDDRKATRKPLVNILDLTPDAADVTIIQATHEKTALLTRDAGNIRLDATVDEAHVVPAGGAKADAALFHAIEDTAGGELGRAKKLNAMLPKMDELAKLGQSLEPHVDESYQRQGPGKASEVKQELSASLTVLGNITTKARRSIRECDDFVSDLQRAVATGDGGQHHERRDKVEDKADKVDKPEKADKPDKNDKPELKPKPEVKPKPKPVTVAKKDDPPPPPKPTPAAQSKLNDAPPPKPAPVAKKDDAPPPPSPPPPPPPKPKPKPQEGEVFNP